MHASKETTTHMYTICHLRLEGASLCRVLRCVCQRLTVSVTPSAAQPVLLTTCAYVFTALYRITLWSCAEACVSCAGSVALLLVHYLLAHAACKFVNTVL
jgi:hypothetical protein